MVVLGSERIIMSDGAKKDVCKFNKAESRLQPINYGRSRGYIQQGVERGEAKVLAKKQLT